jgi:hypothetical protein
MARPWKPREFDTSYERYICQDEYQFGGIAYYLKYRSRFKECIRRFAVLAPDRQIDVLARHRWWAVGTPLSENVA